jgi:hypothetical protein
MGFPGNELYQTFVLFAEIVDRFNSLSLMFRQLASDGHGFPLFEIYFAEANGGYNLQVR